MDPDDRGGYDLLRFSHLGIQFGLVVALLTGAGLLLDRRWGTTPLLTVLGGIVGFGAGTYLVWREIYGREK